jgi:4,5-DOPA dioxygenase extradiol
MVNREWDKLTKCLQHPDFKMCNPTPEHFLPILVVAGASKATDTHKIITEGYDGWSLSMLSIAYVGKDEHLKSEL